MPAPWWNPASAGFRAVAGATLPNWPFELVMTYNFDPDRWYEDQRRLLDWRRQDGTLDDEAWEKAAAELERRYEDMLARLDATYQLRQADSKQ